MADSGAASPHALRQVRTRLTERTEQLAGQSSVFLATLVASKAAVFLFTIYLARTLGAEPLGLFALGFSLSTLLATVALYGLPEAALRYLPLFGVREEGAKTRNLIARSAKITAGVAAVAGAALLLLRGPVARGMFAEPELGAYLPAFGAGVVLLALYRLFRHQLRGLQRAGRESTLNLTLNVGARIVLSVALIAAGFGLWGYVTGYLAALALGGAVMAWSVWRELGPGPGWAGREPLGADVHDFSRFALGGSLVAVAIERGDRVLLGFFLDAATIGVYDVAMAVALTLPVALSAVNAVLGPVISELHEEDEIALLGVLAERTNKWVTAFTLPGAVCLMAFAPEVMGLFGDRFADGWPVLVLLVGAQAVNVAMGSTGALVSMSGHQREHFGSMVLAAATLVVLDLALIPVWGAPGAAVAFLAAIVLQYGYLWWKVNSLLGVNPVGAGFRPVLAPLAAGTGAILALRLLTRGGPGPWWAWLVATAVLGYAISLALVAWWGTDEVDRVMGSGVRAALLRFRGEAEEGSERPEPAGREPFYGQHGEDAVLWHGLDAPDHGYYVEVGALDGLRFSNTLFFEERGWEGLLVEPHPDYFDRLEENRPGAVCVEAAASDADRGTAPLFASERGALSTLDGEMESFFRHRFKRWFSGFEVREVEVKTLDRLLEEAGAPEEIELVSIDVEGHELAVLRGLDLERRRPRVIVAEAMTEEAAAELVRYLEERGYVHARRLEHNLFFAADPEVARRLREAEPESVSLHHHPHPLDREGAGRSQLVNWVRNAALLLLERLRTGDR